MRLIHIAILTAALVIGGFVFLENRELHKIIPVGPLVNVGLLLGQALTIVSASYFLAHRAHNLTDTITEVCIIFASIFVSLSVLGPHMFLKQTGVHSPHWWEPWKGDTPILVPNTILYFGLIPAGICLLAVIVRIYFLGTHAK